MLVRTCCCIHVDGNTRCGGSPCPAGSARSHTIARPKPQARTAARVLSQSVEYSRALAIPLVTTVTAAASKSRRGPTHENAHRAGNVPGTSAYQGTQSTHDLTLKQRRPHRCSDTAQVSLLLHLAIRRLPVHDASALSLTHPQHALAPHAAAVPRSRNCARAMVTNRTSAHSQTNTQQACTQSWCSPRLSTPGMPHRHTTRSAQQRRLSH